MPLLGMDVLGLGRATTVAERPTGGLTVGGSLPVGV
jgi:hypothetical protein